jgi:site-specific DNA-cytosine methylase
MIDIKTGNNVLDLPDEFGTQYDLVLAAPPCDQFTKANAHHWEESPDYFINVAWKCFKICLCSQKNWVLENPPGRIQEFLPSLIFYRQLTFIDPGSNKEYVLYSNSKIMQSPGQRYGKEKIHAWDKSKREMWTVGLIESIKYNFNL